MYTLCNISFKIYVLSSILVVSVLPFIMHMLLTLKASSSRYHRLHCCICSLHVAIIIYYISRNTVCEIKKFKLKNMTHLSRAVVILKLLLFMYLTVIVVCWFRLIRRSVAPSFSRWWSWKKLRWSAVKKAKTCGLITSVNYIDLMDKNGKREALDK